MKMQRLIFPSRFRDEICDVIKFRYDIRRKGILVTDVTTKPTSIAILATCRKCRDLYFCRNFMTEFVTKFNFIAIFGAKAY